MAAEEEQQAVDTAAEQLDRIADRAVITIDTALRRAMDTLLRDLKRLYQPFLDPTRTSASGGRANAGSISESASRLQGILEVAQAFMSDAEIQAWQARFQNELAEAMELGGALAQDLQQVVNDGIAREAGAPNQVAIWAAAQITGTFIRGETMKFRNELTRIVTDGVARGRGFKSIEKDIRVALLGSSDSRGITTRLGLRQRAELIARSELSNAYVDAQRRVTRQLGVQYVQWIAAKDELTCPLCVARHGQIYKLSEVVAPAHPRCVLGDTYVSPGPLAAAFRSVYRGNVVTIRLEGGSVFTVTANHPMLTTAGWVKAEILGKGHQLVGHSIYGEGVTVGIPNLNDVPATAEDIFTALQGSGAVTSVSMPVTPLDLHGDGGFIDGNIDVVRADGLLNGYRESSAFNELGKGESGGGSVRFRPFTSFCHADAAVLWLSAAAQGSMSSLRDALALFRGGLSHAEEHRIAATAWRDPVMAQDFCDNRAGNVKLFSQGLDAGPAGVFGDDRFLINGEPAGLGGYAVLRHESVDNSSGNPQLVGDLRNAQASFLELHNVVEVEVNPFHGHVYTFETFAGAYAIGAGVRILTKNCRCAISPVIDEAIEERDPKQRDILLDAEYWRNSKEQAIKELQQAKGWTELRTRDEVARALRKITPSEKYRNPDAKTTVMPAVRI